MSSYSQAPACARIPPVQAHDGRLIQATRGGGIFLDPHVWAITPEEEEDRRRARGRHRHVHNRATNRLEPLGLLTVTSTLTLTLTLTLTVTLTLTLTLTLILTLTAILTF